MLESSYLTKQNYLSIDSSLNSWHTRNDSLPGATADAAFAPFCFFGGLNGPQLADGKWPWSEPERKGEPRRPRRAPAFRVGGRGPGLRRRARRHWPYAQS